jgi:isocitrate dehydrogenase
MPEPTINWTFTDEAPMLATFSLLPIVEAFTRTANVKVVNKDISVAGRVIGHFPENLTKAQKMNDILGELGELAKTPEANIVKLPNISASIPQLKECIKELQSHGYKVPDYPEDPKTDAEKDIKARYAKVLGSAVNPVLREGNSDRRAAVPVKEYAKKFPHKMGPWAKDSKTHVAHMSKGDFFANEKSVTMTEDCDVRIEHQVGDETTVLKPKIALLNGEVLDATFMSAKELRAFYEKEITDCKKKDILLSLHLKATMMKVSDPILFGHCVQVYFKELFEKHADTFKELGVNANNGFGDVMAKIQKLGDCAERKEIEKDIDACYASRPRLAMVNSDKGITGLHVPSDFIIDASMPAMIRGMDGLGGGMWTPDSKHEAGAFTPARDSKLEATKALIPDRCYAGVFREAVDFCKKNGAFNVSTMGTVPNVGLMAQKAEEYGSHDKTFEIKAAGKVRVVHNGTGEVIMEHNCEEGDIYRACQVKDIPIQDWVKLAVTRARATGAVTVFWLNKDRAHDRNIIAKVEKYLPNHDTKGLQIKIMAPNEACRFSLQRAKDGKDTISVTGNVLRDYNTDLFPILELGTSAKMLSIVPLLAGGGMYETGAGGSAPKHVEQFTKENHLRWDSLGEFLALAPAIEDIGTKGNNTQATVLSEALNAAIAKFLDEDKSPGRKKMEIDNRGSHFYLALYWAEAMATQTKDTGLQGKFQKLHKTLSDNEAKINQDLIDCQGNAVDIGGYYHPDHKKVAAAMRPCKLFNDALDALK